MVDFYGYIERMEKTLQDKLFFVNYVDIAKFDVVIDFGCANGALIYLLNEILPNQQYIGYDISTKMIEFAKNNVKNNNIKFYSNIDELKLKIEDKNYLIIFSSVLHEIDYKDYPIILDLMKNSRMVVIRDMFFDKNKNKKTDCDDLLKNKKNDKYLQEFEQKYGKIDNLLNLYHYFLKYTYTQNWETELLENYFGINYDYILTELRNVNFETIYDNQFTLPYKKEEVKNNFNYDLNLPTHRKLIMKRR